MQKFPTHITHFLGNMYKEAFFYEHYRPIPLSQWSDKWRGPFHSISVDTLLAMDRYAQGLIVKKSTIAHSASGLGVFAARAFRKVETIGHYYGSLVYKNLYTKPFK